MTKHASVEVSGQTVKTCLIKHRSNNWYWQAAKQALNACPHQTCLIHGCPNEQNIAHQTRKQKKWSKLSIKCLMAFKCYKTRRNTIIYDQTRSSYTKQTVKCLFTNQCLMVFGHQTFLVCPGPYSWGHKINTKNANKLHLSPWQWWTSTVKISQSSISASSN